MNAAVLWIFIPFGIALLTLLMQRGRTIVIVGGVTSLALALIALAIPIDVALRFGPISFKISGTFQILGRNLVLNQADQSLLVIIYGMVAFWFFGSEAAGVAWRLVPLGLAITTLLVASLAVEPFLYAALLIEIAVLIAVPLLAPPNQRPGRGVVRFLIYQSLAMPFILFAGWLLPGVEASPGDLALAVQSAIMLGLGFAFLLAVFPLYSWIPMLSEESSPYVLGFILWILPTMTMLFCMGFLDRYSWLRNSPAIPQVLRVAGLLMVTTGGIWAAFQRHLGRMMGYAAIVETGFYLLALSLLPDTGVEVAVRLILPRSLGLAIWALALATLKTRAEDLRYASLQGALRLYPVASAGLVLAQFSAVGLPLTAGFPVHLALLEDLARQSLATTVWTLIGILGLLIGAMRTLAVLVMAPEDAPWERNETLTQTILLGIGILIIFILGLFPGLFQPFFKYLPVMFEHLGL